MSFSSSSYKKDLKYSSFEEFLAQSQFDFSKLSFNNLKICNSLMKLSDEGNTLLRLGDDEMAYILLMRFFESFIKLRNSRLYKEDKKYVDGFISNEKLCLTMSTLEKLKEDIRARYAEKEEKKVMAKLAEVEIKKNEIDVKRSSDTTSVKPSIQTSINCKQLLEFANKPGEKLLIIDVRPQNEYNTSHMNLNLALSEEKKRQLDCINVPGDLIEIVVWKLSEALKKYDERVSKIFEARHSYDNIIIFDKDSADLKTNDSKLSIFKRAVYDYDDVKRFKNEPIILEGGWAKWCSMYPGYTQSSKNCMPYIDFTVETALIINTTIPSIKNVLDFDYPEIHEVKKPTILPTLTVAQTPIQLKLNIQEDNNPKQVTTPIPNVNRMNKPKSKNPLSVVSNNAKEISLLSSSSDDEEDRKIFQSQTSSTKPEIIEFKDLNSAATQQQQQPIIPISYSNVNGSVKREIPVKPTFQLDSSKSNNIDDKIYNTVYAPVRLDKPFSTPFMSNEGSKFLNTNTGIFSYKHREKIAEPPKIPNKVSPLLVKEPKFVPPPPPATQPLAELKRPSSNLKRTSSSPNIAKLDDDILETISTDSKEILIKNTTRTLFEPMPKPTPKPTPKSNENTNTNNNSSNLQTRPDINRNSKPMPEHEVVWRIQKLEPVMGNVAMGLTGIRNFGNTCFMNSILQCLTSTEKLVNFFLDDKYKMDLNRTNNLGFRGEIADEFYVIVKAIWGGNYRIISPFILRSTIGQFNQQFISNDQQDSQELLLFLLDGLHEDLNRIVRRPKIAEIKDDETEKMSDRDAANASWNIHLSINNSIIVDLFQGQFKSTVTCSTCSKKSVKFDAFMYLTLPLLPRHCNLYQCLELFLQPEQMTGESQWKCPRCKQYRNAVKKIDIWKLPPILIIHLKRFKYHGVWRDKVTTLVDYPLENLNLEKFSLNKPANKYHLYGISNHIGNLDGGHYTAMCRHFIFKKWFRFDDSNVKEINDLSTLNSATSYILFYAQNNN
jgi:ubiquitin carboxyl-terminal hydrolase 8